VAEYERVFGTLKVTSRISCRSARPSDLGRFASVIASIDFTIYTPWVAFELLENDPLRKACVDVSNVML
jgi:hypothetical protein